MSITLMHLLIQIQYVSLPPPLKSLGVEGIAIESQRALMAYFFDLLDIDFQTER
jgi:hypothetical protein